MERSAPHFQNPAYYRLAVAQIDVNPAFSLGGHDLLQEPWPLQLDKLALHEVSVRPDKNPERFRSCKASIASAYSATLAKRVTAIVDWCAALGVQLLAFPEYSIPAALLPQLHRLALRSNITIVAGTHHVTPRLIESGTYGAFASSPKIGNAVAPIVGIEQPVIVSKLTTSQWEPGSLIPGQIWSLVPWKDGLKFAVLICLDCLHHEDKNRARFVTHDVLQEAAFIVTISWTPTNSTESFAHNLEEQLKGYHRPSLFVNAADCGGSRLFVARSPTGPIPVPLAPGEQGVLVWDVRLDLHALTRPTGNEFIPAAKPVAAAHLIERGQLPGYADFLQELEGCPDIESALALLRRERGRLQSFGRTPKVPEGVRRNIGWVMENLESITDPGTVRQRLRHIVLPDDVPSMADIRLYNADRAWREIQELIQDAPDDPRILESRSHLEKIQRQLRSQLTMKPQELETELSRLTESWAAEVLPVVAAAPVVPAEEPPAPSPSPEAPILQPAPPPPAPVPAPVDAGPAPESASKRSVPLGSPPLPETPQFSGALRQVWARLHEQLISTASASEPTASLIRLGNARGWQLRGRVRGPEEIDLLWWRDPAAVRDHIEVIPESCPQHFKQRLPKLRRRLIDLDGLVDWQIEASVPKLRQALIDLLGLAAHARSLVNRFDDDVTDLPHRYIPLRCRWMLSGQSERTDAAQDALDDWLEGHAPLLVLLGDFGSGKSTTLGRWARDQAARFLAAPASERGPVFVDLREAEPSNQPAVLLHRALGLTIPGARELIELAAEQGLITAIFDGWDELLRQQDEVRERLFARFVQWTGKPQERTLLSCRSRHFLEVADLSVSGRPLNRLQGLPATALDRGSGLCVLLPFDEAQIQQYLETVAPGQAAALWRFIAEAKGLDELVAQPQLLSMIVALRGPVLAEERRESALVSIYQQYTGEWLCDTLAALSPEEREERVRAFALSLWERRDGEPELEPEPHEDLRTAPFFRINQKDHRSRLSFVHTSFLEYFVALEIARRLEKSEEAELPGRYVSPEVAAFLAGLFAGGGAEAGRRLDRLVRSAPNTRQRGKALYTSYLVHACRRGIGDALRTALAEAWGEGLHLDGIALCGSSLRYASLRGAHLTGANLSGCDLVGADLTDALLSRANLGGIQAAHALFERVDLSEARLLGATLTGAKLSGCDLADARLDGARLDDAALDGAILAGASLCGASLVEARLQGAKLTGTTLRCTDLTRCDLSSIEGEGADLSYAVLDAAKLDGAHLGGGRWSGAVLRDAQISAATSTPPSSNLAAGPPMAPFDLFADPVLKDGEWTVLGPPTGLTLVDWSPDRKILFAKERSTWATNPRIFAFDAACGHVLACFYDSFSELHFSTSGERAMARNGNAELLLDTVLLRVLRKGLVCQGQGPEVYASGSRVLMKHRGVEASVLQLIDTSGGQEICTWPLGWREPRWLAVPGRNGALISTEDRRVRFVDLITGKELFELPGWPVLHARSDSGLMALVLRVSSSGQSPDDDEDERPDRAGRWELRIYDADTGALRAQMTPEQPLHSVHLTPDGKRLLISRSEELPRQERWSSPERRFIVEIFDLDALPGTPAVPTRVYESEALIEFKVSPHCQWMAEKHPDGTLEVMEIRTGDFLPVLDFPESRLRVEKYEFSEAEDGLDGTATYDSFGSREPWRYDLTTKQFTVGHERAAVRREQQTRNADGAADAGPRAAREKDGRIYIAGGASAPVNVVPGPAICMSEDLPQDRLVVAQKDGLVRLFDLHEERLCGEWRIDSSSEPVLSVDARALLIQASDGLHLIDCETSELRFLPEVWLRHACLSPDGAYLAASATSTTTMRRGADITLFSVRTAAAIQTIALSDKTEDDDGIEEDATWRFIADDRLIVRDRRGHRLRLFDAATGKELCSIERRDRPRLSPQGAFIAISGKEDTILFEARQGKEYARVPVLLGRAGWSPDSGWLAGPRNTNEAWLLVQDLRTDLTHEFLIEPILRVLGVSMNGQRALLETDNGELVVVAADGCRVRLARPDDARDMEGALFCPDDVRVLIQTNKSFLAFDSTTGALQWQTGRLLPFRGRAPDELLDCVRFSADGSCLLTGGFLLNLSDGELEPRSAWEEGGESRRKRRVGANRYRRSSSLGSPIVLYDKASRSNELFIHAAAPVPYLTSASGRFKLLSDAGDLRCALLSSTGRIPLRTALAELTARADPASG